MSDTIGRITVPSSTPSVTFPTTGNFRTEWGFTRTQRRNVVTHQFGSANSKIEQRFYVGNPAVRHTWRRTSLNNADRATLRDFWDARHGPNQPFFYESPQEDGTFITKTVTFENEPASFEEMTNSACSVGLTFVEVPSSTPSYSVSETVTRFPSTTLASSLLGQVQEIVPLVHIQVSDASYNSGNPHIYLSDRRITVGGITYLPRLTRIGEPGSGVLIQQSLDGSTDDVSFTFGNADRVMTQLANDTQLHWAKIELSLFRKDSDSSGTLLKLWGGYVTDWKGNQGPEFTMQASDILSALTLSNPVGSISRSCWRRYQQDGCPATGALDSHFPSAQSDKCDLGFNTANGCMAHQASHAFGATYCSPQGVMLRRGRISVGNIIIGAAVGTFTGVGPVVGGLAGATFTNADWTPRVSIVADTIFGSTLAEIYHNDDGIPNQGLPLHAKIAFGRDEDNADGNAFYTALGIVGKGPLSGYTAPRMLDLDLDGKPETFVGPTLDGFYNHGFQVDGNGNLKDADTALYGLRTGLGQPIGSTPVETDYFALGRVDAANSPRGWYTQGSDGSPMLEVHPPGSGNAYNAIFSAGTAFVEIRRQRAKEDPASAPSTHDMVVMVSGGLSCWAWSAPGTRFSINSCTNPFWVALNTYLRAIGKYDDDASTQEQYFDVQSFIDCATIANNVVPRVIGSGNETQFRFMGVIDQPKPTRDWLQTILTNALGNYTWSFGKLRALARVNSSTTSAFTDGNMLFGSLALEPVKPSFEKITVAFQDREYAFESNTVDYVDQDHAARNNRVQNPLARTLTLAGCTTKSQAARFAVVRTREELGGADQEEQDKARLATFRTTIVGLDCEAGSIISVTNADVPGGSGEFRVQSWRLNADWSIDIQAKSTTDHMYDLAYGPKPQDVAPTPIPVEPPRDVNVPPIPEFAVERSALDATVAQIVGLTFADLADTATVRTGTFEFWFADLNAADYTVGTALTDSGLTLDLASPDAAALADRYVLVEGEVLRCGHTPTASDKIPVTRAQLGSTAAAHALGVSVLVLQRQVVTANFAPSFFATAAAANWKLPVALPNTKVAAVTGQVTNAFGLSPIQTLCQTGNGDHGLLLEVGANGKDAIFNITNSTSDPALEGDGSAATPFKLQAVQAVINLVATTADVYLKLPNEEDMVGRKLTINLVNGSTKAGVLVEDTGDTLNGDGANYRLSTAGSSITIEGT